MGNSLHNKIYLGRRHGIAIDTRRVQAVLCIGAFASIGLVWLLVHALK